MRYFVSFSRMDADFAAKAAIDRPESIGEMQERRAMLFENSAFFHKIVGLWPKEDQLLGHLRAFKCRAGIFCTIVVALMQYGVLALNEDRSRMAEFSIDAAISTLVITKVLLCTLKRKKLIEMYHKTLEINSYPKESSAEKKIAYKWLSLQTKLISNVLISYLLLVTVYLFYPIFRGAPFPIAPSLFPKELHQLPWSTCFCILQLIVCYLRVITVISCDIYLIILMCQICSELQVVGSAVQDIDVHDKQLIFRAIVKHSRVLEYGQLICKEFSSAIVVQHIGMSVATAFSAISVLYTKDPGLVIQFTSIGLILILEILLLCFVGQTIAGESLKVADYLVHKFEIFLDDSATLRTINVMLLRSQRPLSLRVGVYTIINLELFRLTMNKIFSCILILNRAMAESDSDNEQGKHISFI